MAILPVQNTSEAGAALVYAAATAGGDTFVNADDRTFLHVKNGSAGAIDVTITAQTASANVPGLGLVTKANRVVTIAAGADRLVGPFPAKAFNDATSKVAVGYSAVADVTVAAARVPAL